MAGDVHILGIRHHGPGSARTVHLALERLKPDAVLIEGPPDAAGVLPLAAREEITPPVALMVYRPDEPSDAAYYPFAEFSPEWQAIRWGLAAGATVRFIDLPLSMRPAPLEPPLAPDGEPPNAPAEISSAGAPPLDPPAVSPPTIEGDASNLLYDPLDSFAQAAGFEDGEAWWGRLVEERRGEEDPFAVFDAIREAMSAARDGLPEELHHLRDPDQAIREAHMRRGIRAAVKEGFERIAVICGAWHAPVLHPDALKAIPAKRDDEALRGLPRRKTEATWIPWTHGRLAAASGYSAGVRSPGWYEHLWRHGDARTHRASERWMTRVARLMRDEDLDASPAHIIESVRLAESLASLRGRGAPGLEEFNEASLAIICAGNPAPMRLIHRRLIVGERLGQVPDDVPAVPLQRDLTAKQKSLRLKLSADGTVLELDQRKEMDLERSRLLHRLCLLDINWGALRHDQRRSAGTFRETWRLQWKPELAIAVVDAAVHGNTVEQAAEGKLIDAARKARDLPSLTAMMDHVMLAELPRAVEVLVERIQAVSAVSADVAHLMQALPPLVRVLRYGNVRRTDAALVEPLVAGLAARICAGLGPACASLDDDAASAMRERIDAVEAALATLNDPDLLAPWRQRVQEIGDADLHGLVAGRCWRILFDAASPESADDGSSPAAGHAAMAAARLSLALSRGNDPARAGAWLEGFLSGSGAVLVHAPRLLAIVDDWVCSLTPDAFEQSCPVARRTFATFEKPERRMIGERLRRSAGGTPVAAASADDGYDPVRGELVVPVLRLILGEEVS